MSKTIFLATGGTGGHVFPARALAAELLGRGYDVTVVTDQRGQNYEHLFADCRIHRIDAASPSGASPLGKISAALSITRGVRQARRLIAEEAPIAFVGFGGYPSLPTMFAGLSSRLPTILHEQNAVLGRVNKLLSGWVRGLALSFEDTLGVDTNNEDNVMVTGNPVRAEIVAAGSSEYAGPNDQEPLRLFVFGGSQGARILSQIVPEAVSLANTDSSRAIQVVQQCRPEDAEQVQSLYRQMNIDAVVQEFFDDMPAQFARAHLVVARAGAGTVFEISAAGLPSILVPFAAAADDHQTRNAAALASGGGALVMPEAELTARMFGCLLTELADDPARLSSMSAAAKSFAPEDAAGRLADFVLQYCEENGSGERIAA
jgi:UDP-N-acetylglucosamine--N-acetylmuramyl-(pentapeptide) pyrophosphoryl-undecaprenol N-acetylglucosamine transferase